MNRVISIIACLIFALTPFAVLAEVGSPKVSLINHTKKPLTFRVGINPERLPDVKGEFVVNPNAAAISTLLPGKEAYIRAEDDSENFGFFGVELVNNVPKVYGYLSRGLAFSWQEGKVTFCTPEDYKKNGYCV